MRRRLLSITAVLSVVVASALALGYAGYFGVVFAEWRPAGSRSRFVAVKVAVDEGRVQLAADALRGSGAATMPAAVASVAARHVDWRGDFRWRLDVRRVFWEWDARIVGSGTSHMYRFRAPIWCFELPCLVAPLLWLRDRRRHRPEPHGFVVTAK